MHSAENLASIEADAAQIEDAAREDPSTSVPQYPGWSLDDLAGHLGWVYARVAKICRERARERVSGPKRPEEVPPVDWLRQTRDELLEVLSEVDPATPVYGFGEMANVGFWERRMVIETGIHRWDAEQALGDDQGLADLVAVSGLDEFAETWIRFLGEVSPIVIEATDLGRSWQMGQGEATASVRGKASDVLLRLMARPSPVDVPEEWARAVDGLAPPPKP